MRRMIGLGGLLFVLAIAGVSVASAGDPPCKMMAGQPGARMLCKVDEGRSDLACLAACLELSDEQRGSIEKLMDEAKQGRVALRKEMMRARNELNGELLKDEPELGRIRQIVQRLGEIRTQMQIAGLENQLAIRKVLKPEQRDRLILMGPCCGMGAPGMQGHRMGLGRGCGMMGPDCGDAGPGMPCCPEVQMGCCQDDQGPDLMGGSFGFGLGSSSMGPGCGPSAGCGMGSGGAKAGCVMMPGAAPAPNPATGRCPQAGR